jgi:hypothetical protein
LTPLGRRGYGALFSARKELTMRSITLSVSLAVVASAFVTRTASAQVEGQTSAVLAGATHGTGIGVGVAAMLTGPVGVSVAYDGGPWHFDTMLSLTKNDGDTPAERRPSFGLGGRFWFHLHKAANSDFSVGGGLGFEHEGPSKDAIVSLEGGVLLRVFLASNVALSASAGLGVQTADRSFVTIGGQFIGAAAIHYYFY